MGYKIMSIHAKTLLIAACLASAAGACAQEAGTMAATGGLTISSDSDGFDAVRARAGVMRNYVNSWRYSGAALQATRYRQGAYDENVAGALVLFRDQRRDNLAGIDVEAGVVSVAGKLRPVGEATWRLVPSEGSAVDLIASADLVETPKALARGIGTVMAAVGGEKQLGERFTVTGMAGLQSFSDGNARRHLRARLIWLALPDHGATLQLRARHYSSRKDDVGGAYFNPDRYQQWLGVGAIRKRGETWHYTAALGAGRERSASMESRPSYLAEARAERAVFGDGRLVLNAGYYRGAGVVDIPNYSYRLLGVNLIMPLR